jgi:hypothetical protein
VSDDEVSAKKPVTAEDIETALRSFGGETTETVNELRGKIFAVAASVGVGIILVTFWLGRARGKKKTTVVEIRRV